MSFSKKIDAVNWETSPPFSSQYACRQNGVNQAPSKFQNILLNPILNLLPDLSGNIGVPIFSWALLIGVFYLVSEGLPLCFLNSYDGQYTDNNRILAWSLILYYIISIILVSIMFKPGCKQLSSLAKAYSNAAFALERNPESALY